MKRDRPALLVAIVGGSGSGKTWLAAKLRGILGRQAVQLSLDDFYRDRSHLTPARRARLNFDHPRAIDWPAVAAVLRRLAVGRPAAVPQYDFKTHRRLGRTKLRAARPIMLVDGLWLLRRPSIRRQFALKIFVDCPARVRLRRRQLRDRLTRGRTAASVVAQFKKQVQPMHTRFVEPQKRLADVILPGGFTLRQTRQLAARIQLLRRRQQTQ